jgi:hypothetical protein
MVRRRLRLLPPSFAIRPRFWRRSALAMRSALLCGFFVLPVSTRCPPLRGRRLRQPLSSLRPFVPRSLAEASASNLLSGRRSRFPRRPECSVCLARNQMCRLRASTAARSSSSRRRHSSGETRPTVRRICPSLMLRGSSGDNYRSQIPSICRVSGRHTTRIRFPPPPPQPLRGSCDF